jgi:molecular chaperone IbpA
MIYMVIVRDPFAALSEEFDKMFAQATKPSNNYPPYNIIKLDDDNFVMEFAVAGFTKDEIEVIVHKGVLTAKGEKQEDAEDNNYVYKGIAARKFSRSFTLPEHTDVTGAEVYNGILTVNLKREVPEEQKPKTIKIV